MIYKLFLFMQVLLPTTGVAPWRITLTKPSLGTAAAAGVQLVYRESKDQRAVNSGDQVR